MSKKPVWDEAFESWRNSMLPCDQVPDNEHTRRAFRIGWKRAMQHQDVINVEDGELTREEHDLIAGGRLIAAVKAVRLRLGLSLRDSKAYVDKFRQDRKRGL